jgi:hypothetical protein
MTTATSPITNTTPTSGGVVAIVAGGLLAVVALVVLTVGGLALWGDSKKDGDGYLSTGTDRFHTTTHALSTDNLDFDGVYPEFGGDSFGKVRLQATSRDGKPVFVGVAPTGDVDRYLDGTRHTDITDVDYDPFDPSYRDFDGSAPSRPAGQDIWAASAHGGGTQTLDWKVRDGDWSVVVMNDDASAGVDAGVKAGAKLGFLEPLGYGLLGGGLLVLLAGGALIAGGVRSRS